MKAITDYKFTVRQFIGGGQHREVKLILVGGYGYGDTTIVIWRTDDQTHRLDNAGEIINRYAMYPKRGLLKLERNGIVRDVTESRFAIGLFDGDLVRFKKLPNHYQFMLNGRWWRKLANDRLLSRLRNLNLHIPRY